MAKIPFTKRVAAICLACLMSLTLSGQIYTPEEAWKDAQTEQRIGIFNNSRDWESCMTFTGFLSWHGFQKRSSQPNC
jgi:hypothetical protein